MTDIEYVPEIDDIFTENVERGHFGKLKVLNTMLCTLTIGPDYCFFIPAFSFFAIVGILMTSMVFNNSQNFYFRLITVIVCLGQPFSYLNVALSDPGIVTRSIIQIPVEQVSTLDIVDVVTPSPQSKNLKHKYCKKCNIYVKPTTLHCATCQLCIEEYDHHCPWVSKCIGKNNLAKFYIFLSLTPVFMIYCFISFFICATIGLVERTPLTV